jgi:ankyrin repeat protein
MQPIGPVGGDVIIDEDLPKYIIRGKSESMNFLALVYNVPFFSCSIVFVEFEIILFYICFPLYVCAGSEEETYWRSKNPHGYKIMQPPQNTGSSDAHRAAIDGNSQLMIKLLEDNPELIHARDNNGWTPLHVSSSLCWL